MTATDRPPAEAAADASSEPAKHVLGALLAPVRVPILVACAVSAVGAVAGIVPFIAVAELARQLLESPSDTDRVWRIVAVAVVALFVRLACMGVAGAVSHFADNDFQLLLRRQLADHLGRVPLGWFDEHHSGQVKKALQDDVSALHHLIGHSFLDLTTAIVTPVAALAYLVSIDWRLTLITLVPLVVGMAMYRQMMSDYGEKMAAYTAALGRVNAASVEFVQGIAVVKAFGQTNRAHRRFLDQGREFIDFFWNWARGMLVGSSVVEIVLSPLVALLVVLVSGTLFVAQGWASPLDVVPFALLGLGITAPFLTLNYSQQELMVAKDAAGRLRELLDTPTLTEAPDGGPSPTGHRVELRGIRFSYDGSHEVLAGIDMVLDPGTVTALVGPSGSGKSTIAKLVPRFWDPTSGSVLLGGVDLRELPSRELYRRVGFVLQDVQLLRTSIRDNIRLAEPDAPDDRVEAAARAAQIHHRIMELPRGYDSVIGEDALLSGGESQRVSIARALLADPPILVLDEATAYADPESEAAIQDALSTLVEGRTLLVIAHRLHTVVGADQILVVDGGVVAERGRHDDLLAAGGRYRQLWDAYQGTEAPAHDESAVSGQAKEVPR